MKRVVIRYSLIIGSICNCAVNQPKFSLQPDFLIGVISICFPNILLMWLHKIPLIRDCIARFNVFSLQSFVFYPLQIRKMV